MRLRRFALIFLLTGTRALVPASALEWKTQDIACTTVPFQTEQEAIFGFKNTGKKTVTVIEVETSCGCVEAATDRKSYAPGESGTVLARVAIGDRFGSYERFVNVLTDEEPTPVRLRVQLEVPELASLHPRSVSWRVNEPAVEKTVDLQPGAGLEIDFAKAEATSEDFTVRLETIQPGRLYRLHLKPNSTAQVANTAVRLYGRDRTGHAVLVSAYGNVQ